MQFSDTTNKDGIIQHIEDLAGLADGVISGNATLRKKATSQVNEVVRELTTDIMLLVDGFEWDDPNRADYPIATTPLIAGQRDYQFDSISFLQLKRVDVTYDGVNWVKAEPLDSASFEGGFGNDAITDTAFLTTAPHYDPKGFGFWLYPRATTAQVEAGAAARIEYSRSHVPYAHDDTDKEPPIDTNFHHLIYLGAAARWVLPKNSRKAAEYFELYNTGREQMKAHYSRRNEDDTLTLGSPLLSKFK